MVNQTLKHNPAKIYLLAGLCFLLPLLVYPQARLNNFGYKQIAFGKITEIANNGKDLYIWKENNGLFKGTAVKGNFNKVTPQSSFDSFLVIGIIAFKSHVLVATLENGLYLVESGKTPRKFIMKGSSESITIFCIAKFDSIALIGSDEGLFISKDQGKSWAVVTAALIASDSETFNKDTYKNTVDFSNQSIKSLIFLGKRLFLCNGSGNVYFSDDLCNSWHKFHKFNNAIYGFSILEFGEEFFFKGSFTGVYKYSKSKKSVAEIETPMDIKFKGNTLIEVGGKLYLLTKNSAFEIHEKSFEKFVPFYLGVSGVVYDATKILGREYLFGSEGLFVK